MSITRAFTTRRVKQSLELRDAAEGVVSRSNTSGRAASNSISSIRNKISAPVQLISTTNMLSYNAPDIYPKAASSNSTHSSKPEEDSDSTPSVASAASTPPTSPDSPFPAKRAVSPEPNHLSCYFTPPGQTATAPAPTEAPVIPQRAPSHTKKSYDTLNRHRSASRMSEQSGRSVSTKASFCFSRSSSASTSTTATSHSSGTFSTSKVPPPMHPSITKTPLPAPPLHRKESVSHPFGQELAQVSELAEEYSPRGSSSSALQAEEERELANKGFKKFSPDSYLSDVQGLYASFFADEKLVRPLWI